MNTSKLKACLLTACCLVLALLVESQAMDDASDSQEITLCKTDNSESYLGSLKLETDNSSFHATLPLNEYEKSTASWGSYVASPIKSVIHGTYNIADFAVKHPTQTIVTSLIIGAQLTAMVSAVRIPSKDCVAGCYDRNETALGDLIFTPYVAAAWRVVWCHITCADGGYG